VADAQAIAQKFVDEKVDLIHCIAILTSQAVVKRIKNIPIVFSSVSDPVNAGLVPKTSLPETKTGTNVTGVSDRWPVHLQFEMSTKFIPRAKKWGTIYNARDANSRAHIKKIRESAKKLGVELIEAKISIRGETMQAVQSLSGKVQAIHLTHDHTVTSAFGVIVKVCNEKKIPLFTGDVYSVPRGAIAAYGLDYFFIGHSAGKRAARILAGEKPGDIPWGTAEKLSLVVSELRNKDMKMQREVSLIITDAYRLRFPNLSFGIGTIQDCTYFEKSDSFKLYKREFLRKMRRRTSLAQIEERINLYDQFFKEWGYPCPLLGHFKRTIEMGFPIVNLYIDTHIIAEMYHGILMAIQDLDRFQGKWRLDLASEGETFQGVSGNMIRCKKEEIVLRDEEGIVCSLFQGPDFRTKVDGSSKDIVVYVFTAPGVQEEQISNGIQLALEILQKFGNGKDPWWKVFRS
jgi:putative ABC transport system substrate-binding protein